MGGMSSLLKMIPAWVPQLGMDMDDGEIGRMEGRRRRLTSGATDIIDSSRRRRIARVGTRCSGGRDQDLPSSREMMASVGRRQGAFRFVLGQ
jgi:signal recognition particle GTPase